MAYRITIDGTTVYNQLSADKAYHVLDPTWVQEIDNGDLGVGKSGHRKVDKLTFTMPIINVGYGAPVPLRSTVLLYDGSQVVFRGRVLKIKRTMYGDKQITCGGDMGFLQDSIMRPFSWRGRDLDFLAYVGGVHNSQVGADRQFVLPTGGGTTDLDIETEDYMSCFDVLNEFWRHDIGSIYANQVMYWCTYLIEENGVIRSQLGFYGSSGSGANEDVSLGKNMLDITDLVDAEELYTVLIPLGASVDTGQTDSEGHAIRKPLTIESVNGGKDYIEADASVLAQYGRIWRTASFPDIGPDDETTETEAAQELKEAGEEELAANMAAAATLDVSAVELHQAGLYGNGFRIGYPTRIRHRLLGIDEDFVCSRIERKLAELDKSKYRFGRQRKALTGQI